MTDQMCELKNETLNGRGDPAKSGLKNEAANPRGGEPALKNETANRRGGEPAKGLIPVVVAASLPRPFAPSLRRLFAASPRRRVAPSLCLMFVLFLTSSCGPKRNAAVAENAQHGYCPVCGMQVNASDPWAAEIRYNDSTKLMFESPADMLAFYVSPTKYSVNDLLKEKGNIKNVQLKDYNSREPIDGADAELVMKSRVDGPMGPDFFPFSTRQAAELFASTNGGTIIRLADVTIEIVRELGRN